MEITEKAFFDVDLIRKMCVMRNLYTRGNNEDYMDILQFARNAKVNTDNLLIIAENIATHSDLLSYGCTYRESVENFVYVLANDCVIRTFEFTY